jgi:uncharacterized protein YecE (DUF72 family)
LGRGKIFIGTSGYSYQHWKGIFYPKDLKENRWLEHYARYFQTVELNVTFYRLPRASVFSGWYKRVPKNFRFAVKGSRFITHLKHLKDCAGPLGIFFSRVKRLKEKVGVVLWQLPPAFKKDTKRLNSFLRSLRKYKKTRHVFEFRNETWYCKEVFASLKDQNISLCSADWPPFSKSVAVTADFAYIRRHGQGAKLYSGRYSKPRLKRDARGIRKHLKEKRDVYVYFNNDSRGYAVQNALELKGML